MNTRNPLHVRVGALSLKPIKASRDIPTWPSPLTASPAGGSPGSKVQGEDAVRITTQPLAVTRIPPRGLFQYGIAVQKSPVVAVDVSVHRADGDRLTGGVVGFLYANGQYVRPTWNDARGERPWVTVRRDQVVRAWRRGGVQL